MTRLRLIITRLITQVLSFLPTLLPTGATAYEAWLNDIVSLVGPIADEQSLKWVISNEIMRLAPGRDRVPKRVFVKALRKFAANQIAANKVMEIKQAQEAKQKAGDTAKDQACPPTTTNG
jgi:hypothetical protein